MKQTTFSIFLLLLVSTLCLSFTTSASQCGPGQYYQNGPIFNRGCFACPVGFYCPGDDSTHQCSPGSIAAQEGSVSCSACPSNFNTNPQQTRCEKCATGRMTVDEHFCLLSDTPLSAVQFTNNVAVMNSNQLMSFAEVDFAENDYSHRGMTQLTLYNPNGLRFVVYASSTTGRPGPLNYEYFGFGANVTLAIKGTADIPSLIYFNITVIPEKVIPYPIKLITKSYDMIVDQRVPIVEGMNSITLDTHFEGEVIVEYYNKQENDIQFTFNTGGEYMFYHVFYSSNQDVEYPNPNNSDFVYYSGDARKHPSVTVNAVGRRQGVVRVAFQTKYGKGDVIQVQVVLKK